MPNQTAQSITITRPDDFHLHVRDGDAMRSVLPLTARQFGRAIIMPNLPIPVTTVALATAYRERILAALPEAVQFEPLMTVYLTDHTSVDEVWKAAGSGYVHAMKLYPSGATTHSAAGVTDLKHCYKVLEAMQENGMPLSLHGEVTDPEVDIFDKEAVFIDRVLLPLRRDFPELRIVFEHLSTKVAVDYVNSADEFIAATITPQHLLFNRNAIFQGGIRPHYYCLPILKTEEDRQALVKAATSQNKRFFAGTDSAPHPKENKEQASGSGGCFTGLHAMELYTTVFEKENALDSLEAFTSFNGADFYKLPRNKTKVILKKEPWEIPATLPLGSSVVVPLAYKEKLDWKLV
ncbi:MAG: dihydroorotase [Oxalobacter sp.]|nr:MAG: dihydroorotase [Oxalobacter sp.]